MLTMRRRIALPLVLLVAGLALAGCSASDNSASSSVGHAASGVAPATGSTAQKSAGGAESSGTIISRQVVTTGAMVIRTKNPITAADKAASIVDAAGGRVDDRQQSVATSASPADATLTLRIPSTVLTPTIAALKAVGREVSITESSNDVTNQSEDLGARITALQTSITRLLALETKATNTADVITLESDIADRQGQLESLTAQQKTLADQVALSTITLHLIAPSTVIAKPGPPSAGSAFVAGLAGFGVFFTWVFLVLAYALPWLVLAAAVWIAIVVVLRVRRRRTATAPPAAPAPGSALGDP